MQKVLGCFQGWLAYSEEPMEDLTGEEMKRNVDLNLTTSRINENQRGKRKEMNFFVRGKLKIEGKENDMRECKECHKILPTQAFNTHTLRSNGVWALFRICRECKTVINSERVTARKNASPKPNHCECCHKNIKLQVDHVHGSVTFRGWLCRNCNTGLGALGDNLEGVLQAAVYLEKDKSKIIEILNGIKYE